MSSFDLNNQAASGISTPSTGNTTIFVDSSDKLLKSKNDAGVVTNYGAPGLAITALTGEVAATGPGSVSATLSNAAVIGKVLTGLTPSSGVILATDSILEAFGKLVSKGNASAFPTMTDGTVVISSNTTLTRDVYYESLTVNLGATLFTNGFRIFANSIVNNGIIDRSGNDSTGITGGAALAAGTLGGAVAGGNGGTAAGTAGVAATSLGGAGGAGGAGSGGAGGAGGTYAPIAAGNGGVEVFQRIDRAVIGRDIGGVVIPGGSGGGGGGGDGVAGGGGGGGAGGVLVICARTLAGTGIVRARGGNGGTPVAGNRGGGGGGGGGTIVLITENDTTMTSLTFDVAGGIGSSGTGTGVAGVNGSAGRIFRIRA